MVARGWLGVPIAVVLAACGGAAATKPPPHAVASAKPGVPSPASCPPPAIAPAPTPSPVQQAAAPPGEVQATIPIDAGPGGLHFAFGSVWTVNHRSNTIARIDPATSKVVATIPVESGSSSIGIGSLDVGAQGLWVPVYVDNGTQLWRLNPATNQFDKRFPIESLGNGVETESGALWVNIDVENGPAKRDSLERLDPGSGSVLQTVDLAAARAGLKYTPQLAYGLGSLWVPVANDTVMRVDPQSARVIAAIKTPGLPSGYGIWAFASGKAYLALYDYSLARIDAATNCVDGIIYLGQKLARQADPLAGPVGLIPSPDTLYVEFDRGALAKVDLTSLRVSSAVRVDEQDYISDAVYAAGSIWFSTFGNNTVLRLRPL